MRQRIERGVTRVLVAAASEKTAPDDGLRLVLGAMALGLLASVLF